MELKIYVSARKIKSMHMQALQKYMQIFIL